MAFRFKPRAHSMARLSRIFPPFPPAFHLLLLPLRLPLGRLSYPRITSSEAELGTSETAVSLSGAAVNLYPQCFHWRHGVVPILLVHRQLNDGVMVSKSTSCQENALPNIFLCLHDYPALQYPFHLGRSSRTTDLPLAFDISSSIPF